MNRAASMIGGRFHYGWVVVAVVFLVLLASAGTLATPSVLMVPLGRLPGWSRASVSLAISINLALYGLMGPFAAAAMQRFGVRRTVLSALGVMATGVALSALMTHPWQMILIWGVVVGSATGVMALSLSATVVNRWFATHRGLAMGILTASSATGQLVFLPFLAAIAQHRGWQPVVLVVAAAIATMVPIVAYLLPERPADVHLRPYGEERDARPTMHAPPDTAARAASDETAHPAARETAYSPARETAHLAADEAMYTATAVRETTHPAAHETTHPPTRETAHPAAHDATHTATHEAAPPTARKTPPETQPNPLKTALAALVDASRTRDFWLLFLSFFICGASTNGYVGTHLISMCHDYGMSEVQGASLLATMGVFDLFGTTFSGWLSDRLSSRVLLFWYYGLRGLSLIYLPHAFGIDFFGLPLFAVFYGLDWVATVPPTVRLTTDVFGRERAPIVFGWIVAGHQLGAAFATLGAGLLRASLGTYTVASMISGGLCLAGALMALGINRGTRNMRAKAV